MELLPCPFCGNEPAISNYAQNWYGCPNANCSASVINTSAATWNTRAPDARVQLLAKALRQCMVWMESTRRSGDAGFWDWSEGDEYMEAKVALAEAGITQEKVG